MDLGLRGKKAIVTGGASGIGAAIVLELAREGCDVAVVDRRPEDDARELMDALEAVGTRSRYVQADVRDAELADRSVAAIVEAFGGLDILVYCAGVRQDAMSWKMTAAQWDEVMAVNLTGCFHWNRAAAAVLRGRRSGRIVNISSINGLRGKLGQANYAASKAGVIGLSKTLARELGPSGVTVNVVAPGMVRTSMTSELPRAVVDAALRETLTERLAEPEDCAAAVAFLCSERASRVTGHVLQVDSGQYL